MPWTHEAIQSQSPFDLLIGFWEDYYVKNPVESKRTESGQVVFSTGDPLIDKWESEIARGLEPDLTEGLSTEERAKERLALERLLTKKQNITKSKAAEEFADNYADLASLPVLGKNVPKTR